MKRIIFTSLIILSVGFNLVAQTPEKIYETSSTSVKNKIDENKKNGVSLLSGITSQHVFKIKGPMNYSIADLDVHIIEAPGMINYAMNLTYNWSRIKSLEFDCNASYTLHEIKEYFSKVNVTIVKDKVKYILE
jgi:hypothetical protein